MRSVRFLTDDGTVGIALGIPENFSSAAPYLLCHLNGSDKMYFLVKQHGLDEHRYFEYIGTAILLKRTH